MKRRLLIALLAFGTVAGFAAGFRRLHCRHHGEYSYFDRHEAFERRVAERCADLVREKRP